MSVVGRLALGNLGANKLRFALTALAVLMGVAFVVASFVLTDGLRSTFDSIVQNANEGVDAQVRAAEEFEEIADSQQTIDESVLDVVRAVDEVGEAEGGLESLKVIPVDPDGDALDTFGPPILSYNWIDSELSPLKLDAGEAPDGPREFAMDIGSVEREDYVIGQTYDVIGVDGPEPFTLVGATRFGDENALAGAVLLSFPLDELQRLDGSVGEIGWVDVAAAPGVTPDELVTALDSALPLGLEAVSNDVVVSEDQEEFNTAVDIFGNVLLAFAGVTVFVSIFIISNTFNILMGQRVRQLALLRALGATARQVRRTALVEAGIIAILASATGLGAGVLLAIGLRAIMNGLGASFPDLEIIVGPRTVIVALLVGLGVTLAAAFTPARRASRVPPIAAMQEGYRYGSGEGTRRTIIAIILAVIGLAAIALSLFADPGGTANVLLLMAFGAMCVFISVTMFAPLFSSPTARALGRPLEHVPWLGFAGHMARENSARDNKRTARTAAGLMIGLALVAMATVVATSLKDSFRANLGSTLEADFLVTSDNGVSFSNRIASQIESLPEFDLVAPVRNGKIRVEGDTKDMRATLLDQLTTHLAIDLVAGDPASNLNGIAIHSDVADELGLGVGDRLPVEFAATGSTSVPINAVYDNDFLITKYVIDLSLWEENFTFDDDITVSIVLADGVTEAQGAAALAPIADAFPQLDFETGEEFRERLEGQLDSLLVSINVLLGLAIIIALMGISNTMALSIVERTREIGLMRAVGLTRRQTRSMVRWEAAVVSLFGAILGAIVGLGFGWVAVTAIPDSVIDRLAVPVPTLIVYIAIATIAGVIAASLPARRAARLDILDAIGHL